MRKTPTRRPLSKKAAPRTGRRLTLDESVIAVMIAAMEANQHVSPEEAARAQHIIWSMRRFRNQPGERVNPLIDRVRQRIERDDVDAVLAGAARTIPRRLRAAVFAVALDLMLVDTRLERAERQFVTKLATALQIPAPLSRQILEVIRIKNSA